MLACVLQEEVLGCPVSVCHSNLCMHKGVVLTHPHGEWARHHWTDASRDIRVQCLLTHEPTSSPSTEQSRHMGRGSL